MNLVNFQVDQERCIGCGKCMQVCPGGIIYLDAKKHAALQEIQELGWNGCWQCEHCLAVCPQGAISILGRRPEDSVAPPDTQQAWQVMSALVANRHSCRRYQDRNVSPSTIEELMQLLAKAPNGGNKQQVEFTLIDDKEKVAVLRRAAYQEMERLAAQGIFPAGFDRRSYQQMKAWRQTVRPDMLFCGAPHLLIPHAPVESGTPYQDMVVAAAYFELLCAAKGLGAVMMTFPLEVLRLMPEVASLLQIPRQHEIPLIVGFGYPQIRYARGSQRTLAASRIHRPDIENGMSARSRQF